MYTHNPIFRGETIPLFSKNDHIPIIFSVISLFPADDCTVTSMSLLLTSFFYRMWFFGAAYYWGTWVFLGVRLASQGSPV